MNNPTISGLLNCGQRILKLSNLKDIDCILECRILLAYLLDMDMVSFFMNLKEKVAEQTVVAFCDLLKRRIKDEPIAYLTGAKEFMSMEFDVSPACLIPRNETELLVETVIDYIQNKNLTKPKTLEIGTGSGCISVSIAKAIPDCEIVACDISKNALEIAYKNAKKHGVGENIKFLQSDFYSQIPSCNFDIIVSNPPYIAYDDKMDENVRKFEPKEALWSEEEGLYATRKILENSDNFLIKNGLLAVEINSTKAKETIELFRNNGFFEITCLQDFAGKDRVVYGKKLADK